MMKTTEEIKAPSETDTAVKLTKEEKKAQKQREKNLKQKDKKEGRRIRSLDPINQLMPFLMKERNDACNFFESEFDIQKADEYISQKRRAGLKSFSMMHVLMAAYVRTIAEYPGVNRFIRGQRIMARNKIVVALNIKREMSLDKGETVVKFFPKPDATAEEIYYYMEETIQKSMETTDTDFDNTIAKIAKLPRFLLRFFMAMLRFLDYYGVFPPSLLDVSPFHCSFYITSMGSLGIPPIYHHIYNFGNVPLFLSFGATEKKLRLNLDGSVTQKRYLPIKVTCDERICDGHYFSMFFKAFRRYVKNPELLDTPPAEVKEDLL